MTYGTTELINSMILPLNVLFIFSKNNHYIKILNKYYTSVFKSENNEIELYDLVLENDKNQ